MFQYAIEGKITPETQLFPLLQASFPLIKIPEIDLAFTMDLHIENSRLLANINSEKECNDYLTLRNYVREVVELITSIQGYLKGCYYNVEILYFIDKNKENTIPLDTTITELNVSSRAIKDHNEIMYLFQQEKYNFLRLSLFDFGLGIRYPKDTGFFCYRAIESLRKFFHRTDDSKGWELLVNNLKITPILKNEVKKYSSDARHGDTKLLTHDDRIIVLKNTEEILDRFIKYALNGEKPLNEYSW